MSYSTIKNKITISGITPFSKLLSEVSFIPAKKGEGIKFIRTDLNNSVIEVNHESIDFENCFNYTCITNGKDKIKFPEHILSYLAHKKITDINIEINTEECPMFDGSCTDFDFCFKMTGIEQLDVKSQKFFLKKELKVVNPYNNSYIIAKPSDRLIISYNMNFEEKTIENGCFIFDTDKMNFHDEIMPARTFITTKIKEKTNKDYLPNSYVEFGDDNIIAEEKLRFSNEPIRHKILDVIGDFSLIGVSLYMHLDCHYSGHYTNMLMIKEIMSNKDNYFIED